MSSNIVKPNFMVVGAQKCATTSLHHHLSLHPDVYLPKNKETKFFADEKRYGKGFEWYLEENYKGYSGQIAVGEVDPEYMYIAEVLPRLKKHFSDGDIKFIFLLRNPIERAFSHYLMTLRRGLESLSFDDAIRCEQDRISHSYKDKVHYSYVSRGFYLEQIQRFSNYFPEQSMHFMLTEDLQERPREVLRELFDFLGVDGSVDVQNIEQKFHSAKVPHSLGLMLRIQEDGWEKKIVRALIPSEKYRHQLRKFIVDRNASKSPNIEMTLPARRYLKSLYEEKNKGLSDRIGRDTSVWEIDL